jgi:hypothetical protein
LARDRWLEDHAAVGREDKAAGLDDGAESWELNAGAEGWELYDEEG